MIETARSSGDRASAF